MALCKTCRFFVRGEATALSWDQENRIWTNEPNPSYRPHGCSRIRYSGAALGSQPNKAEPFDLASVSDSEGYDASLEVNENFGCILHAPVDASTGVIPRCETASRLEADQDERLGIKEHPEYVRLQQD